MEIGMEMESGCLMGAELVGDGGSVRLRRRTERHGRQYSVVAAAVKEGVRCGIMAVDLV